MTSREADMDQISYETAGGVRVLRTAEAFDAAELDEITRQVQARPGGVLSSGMEYPGRYSRWHLAYIDPPVQIVARGRLISAASLNERGEVLMPVIAAALYRAANLDGANADPRYVEVLIPESHEIFTEEQRSRRPTVFSALREIIASFRAEPGGSSEAPDEHLGLYGAFGYDLAFQFEPVRQKHRRDGAERDLVLHLPDLIYAVDRKRETATRFCYDFLTHAGSTVGVARDASRPARMSLPTNPPRQGRK
jgi:anthranilate synthase